MPRVRKHARQGTPRSALRVSLADIERARSVLSPLLDPTPMLGNRWLSEQLGCEIYLKLENMQPIGSFKIRGATNRIARLAPAQRRHGVVAASAGNHAQGVAWGCAQFGTKATIVMPVNASLTKVQNTAALGAKIVLEGENLEQATACAMRIAARAGAVLVHPYADADVIAGQGTIGLEIIEQLPEVDFVIASMGGGGMITGLATAIKEIKPGVRIIGAQAAGACSVVESVRRGRLVETGVADTFADGIRTSKANPMMLRLLALLLDATGVADDEQIAAAVLTLMEKAKIVAEGSGALPLAVLEKMKSRMRGKKVVLVVSGGNIDVNVLARIIDRGLIKAGRRVRMNVLISDRPGSLNKLTELIARLGANVIQAIHDRDSPTTGIAETGVELTLETRGPEYTKELIQALRANVMRLDLLK